MLERDFEVARAAQAAGRVVEPERAAVAVAFGDVREVQEQRRILLAPRRDAARRQRTQRAAVVRLPARHDQVAAGLAALDVVLPRQLDGRLVGLRAPRDEIGVVQACRREAPQPLGQIVRGLVIEDGRLHVGNRLRLRRQRLGHLRPPVANVHDRDARDGVQVALAVGVVHVHTLAAHDARVGARQVARQQLAFRSCHRLSLKT